MDIALTVLEYLLPVIFSVIGLLLLVGSKKLLDKWGVERSEKIDAMLDDYVNKGVNYAEVMATTYLTQHNQKLPSESKKAKAVRVVLDELEQSGIKGVAEQLIVARIESALKEKGLNPGVPSDPTSGESV